MHWSNDEDEIIKISKEIIGKKMDNKEYFCKGNCSFDTIIDKITNELNNG
jgi:hypothetical protein